MPLETLAIPAGPRVRDSFPALRRILDGATPLVIPHGDGQTPDVQRYCDDPMAAHSGIAVGTSGSTGDPKLAVLTSDALTASADATAARLGGPGRWALFLPAHHIAGLQVMLRTLAHGTEPLVADLSDGFTPDIVTATLAEGHRNGTPARYTSLVPTQLRRCLRDPEAIAALADLDAVLIGGSASSAALLERALDVDIPVRTTYGSSETAGGCVYDGLPLDGTRVTIEEGGRVRLGGPTIASGYLGRPDQSAATFVEEDGTRWFRTDDIGQVVNDRLHITGRINDIIHTGGYKVAPSVVEDAIATVLPGFHAVAVGLPDPEWGQSVGALLVADSIDSGTPPTTDELRALVHDVLEPYARPRRVAYAESVPLRGPGKPDRDAVRRLLLGMTD